MAISLVQQQRPMLQQRMILAPQIIQSIEILQLPLMALQERIDQELLENPLLEVEEIEASEDTDRPDSPEDRKADERVEEGEDFAKLDNLADDYQEYFWQATPRANPGDKDEKLEALANTPGRPPALRDYLIEQIQFMDIEPEPRRILEYLINNLRPDGYLDGELEEIVKTLTPPPAPGEAEKALATLQSLDPPGVGARNLRECLLLQLRAAGETHPLVEKIVRDCLEDVQMNRFPKIKQETGATLEEIKEAVEAIKRLEPAPGRRYDTEAAPYIVPDVTIEYIDGRYEVTLNDSVMPRLRVSSMYRDLTQNAAAGKDAKDYIRQKIDSARWFID
ncbi:MAG TPA: RNA polymerase sigma-54 factor, partial [Candidatus Brocadiia bacterium]|nr:RNA polymerase sigma-54 factor [Candidatus Brocadiia bacterium]